MFDQNSYLKGYVKERVLKDSKYHRKRHLRRRYGLSEEDYQRMADKQQRKCAICGKTRKLVVDHCHDSGVIRGLLCHHCNSALALVENNDLLASAKIYLRNSMASKNYTYRGKAKWAKVFKPDETYGIYQIVLYPDKQGLKAYVKAGHQGEVREDEDGQYVTFRRKPRVLTKKGDIWDRGPPKVLDAEGESFDKRIGNGSEVLVEVSVYDTPKGLGTSLESVTVLKHKEYNPDANSD